MKKLTLSAISLALLSSSLYANNSTTVQISSATKTNQSIHDVTSNVEVITGAELETKNITNVVDALKLVTGITFVKSGGIGQKTDIKIRGSHQNNVLFLIDGIIYNDITNGGAIPEHLVLSNIQRIEIIKGAQSGIWGANAASGVINIITKEAKDGLHGNLNLEAGSFNTKKINTTVSYKNEMGEASLTLSKITSDSFTTKLASNQNINDAEDDKYKNTGVNLKLAYKINDNNKVNFSHKIINSEADYDGVDAFYQDTDIGTITTKNKFTLLNVQSNYNKTTVNINLKQSQFNRKDPTGNTNEFDGKVNEFGIIGKNDYTTNGFLVVGIEKKEYKDVLGKSDYTNNGIFISNQNEFEGFIAGSTIYTQSLRFDDFDKFKDKGTYKFGLKHFHENIKNFVTTMNYGTAYKAPSTYELNHALNELKPQSSKTFDASAHYKNFSLTYFETDTKDLYEYYDPTPLNYSNNDAGYRTIAGNISKINGYEIAYKNSIKSTLVSLSYTNTNARDKDNKVLGRVPKETIKASIDYFGIRKITINLNGEYIGDRWDRNGEPQNGVKTGKYTIVNTVVNYKINKKTKIYLKINNLTNKEYQEVDGYATSPRAYYVGLNVKF